MSTRRAVQTPARPQSEHQELFDQLMRLESPRKDSPFARFGLTDEQGNDELDYVVSVVDLIGSKIEQLRHDRQEDALSPSFASFKEKFAGNLESYPTQAGREDAVFRLKSMFGFPTTQGRPSTSHKRWPLIQQVYLAYPKGTAKLTQSAQRDYRRTAVHASHFEQTVKVALDLAGDVIEDVHAECRAAVRALREA